MFSEIALAACQQEGVDVRNNALDSTGFSLTGQYATRDDEPAITITYRYSKDHRPDLKQAVQEMLVSQDGGVPSYCKSHEGNANDNTLFQERSKALVEEFKKSTCPRNLIADRTLPNQINSPTKTPTLRWVFQILEGVNRVTLHTGVNVQYFIDRMTPK